MNPFERWWDVYQVAATALGAFSCLFGTERYLIYFQEATTELNPPETGLRRFNYEDLHFMHPLDMDQNLRSLIQASRI